MSDVPFITIRFVDEDGRGLTVTMRPRGSRPVRDMIDDLVLDQAEGRTTLLEWMLPPGTARHIERSA